MTPDSQRLPEHTAAAQPGFDRWLSFDRETAERYESEYGTERISHARSAVYIGLLIYNLHNLTSLVLLPDIFWIALTARLVVVTSFSVVLVWLMARVQWRMREWLLVVGMLGGTFAPAGLFWWSSAPLSGYVFGELSLALVFGNMLLGLRFRQAVVFTVGTFAVVAMAVLGKPEISNGLAYALVVQMATACILTLYANYAVEKRRCHDYLVSLTARLDTEIAEAARQQFQNLSLTDALTGLPNRRVLDERLEAWTAVNEPVVLMMIDVDHFKTFNDTLGHPAGDDCLRRIAGTFQAIADRSDALCVRFGGEEFTIAMRHTSELEAARIANRLVKSVEELDITHPGRTDDIGFVTVSVGIALRALHSRSSAATILALADVALYQAKSRGRNQYAFGRDLAGSRVLCS